jgi:diguanylate cyclase (GGDEF)-like protein
MKNSIAYNIFRLFRFLILFILPGGLIVLVTYLSIHYSIHTPWLDKIEKILPYVILSIGILLGWRFHRSRLALVILILFLSERSIYYFGTGGSYSFGHEKNILLINCILLPINIGLFYLVKERGIFNLRGLAKILFILLQPFAVFLLLRLQPDLLQNLSYQFIQYPPFKNLPLPQVVVLIYGLITLIFLVGSLLFKGGPIVRGFFWALVATLLGLLAKDNGDSATLYYSAAGLIIIMSVIETAYAMAFQDELTGLPARRALNTAMHGLGKRYTIAMLDIDFFKKFNDKFGHDVGDQVLCMVASHIKRVGGGGKPFRFGGEEFTILFPGKSKDETIPYLEIMRESIEAAQFVLRGKNRPKTPPRKLKKTASQPKTASVTISIGVAAPVKGNTKPSSVIKAADQALYRAKKRGRNCLAT